MNPQQLLRYLAHNHLLQSKFHLYPVLPQNQSKLQNLMVWLYNNIYIYNNNFNNLFFLFIQTNLHVKTNHNRQDVVQQNFLSLQATLPLKLTRIKSVRTFAGPSIVLKDSLIQPIYKKIVIFKLKSATIEEKNTAKQHSSCSFLFEILTTYATQILLGGILI